MTNVYYYVYWIYNSKIKKSYVGVRKSKIPPNKDIGKKYFSSSTDQDFIDDQQNNSKDYKYYIMDTFDTLEDASSYEMAIHEYFEVQKNENFYNKARATCSGFLTSCINTVIVKDIDGNTSRVPVDSPDYLNGSLTHICKNKVVAKDQDNNVVYVDREIFDKSPELVGITNGSIPVNINGEVYMLPTDHKDVLSGKYRHIYTGTFVSYDKNGNKIRINVSERNSIEHFHYNKNKTLAYDKNRTVEYVYKDDPRFVSGELKYINSGKKLYIDDSGCKFFRFSDDPDVKSGKLKIIPSRSKKQLFKDTNNNSIYLYENDKRVISGEVTRPPETKTKFIYYDNSYNTYKLRRTDKKIKIMGLKKLRAGQGRNVIADSGIVEHVHMFDPRFETGEIKLFGDSSPKSDATKKRMSEGKIGKVWVNNGKHQTCICNTRIKEFENAGYKRGMLPKKKNMEGFGNQ